MDQHSVDEASYGSDQARKHSSWDLHGDSMAPPRGLSTPRALQVKTKKKKNVGHKIIVFLTDLHHILHVRSFTSYGSAYSQAPTASKAT